MTSALRMFILALTMPAFSRESAAPLNFRIPAVSTRQKGFPSRRMIVSVLSRVVPGNLAHEEPFLAAQPVDDRRLADVDPADDGDAQGLFLPVERRSGGQEGGDPLPELVDIDLVLGRDGDDVLVPEPVVFGEVGPLRSASPLY